VLKVKAQSSNQPSRLSKDLKIKSLIEQSLKITVKTSFKSWVQVGVIAFPLVTSRQTN
jgi:hypothetical protein